MGILDFFTPEAGQARRRWLEEQDANLGKSLDYYLAPTGIPDKIRAASGLLAYSDAGDMVAAKDASQNLWANPTLGSAANMAAATGALALPFYSNKIGEGITDVAEEFGKPLMDAARKAANTARRVEMAPNTFGSLGGNLRLKPLASIDEQVAAARQAVLDSPNDPTLFDDYKRVRRMRDEGGNALSQPEVPVQQVNSGLLSDYVGQHAAPMRDGGAPAFNLAGDIYPDDIYSSKAVQYYGTGDAPMDRDTMGLLQSLRGNPDADVTIYRSVPKGVDNLNAGDWVTVNKQYAKGHGESALGGDFDVIEKKVKASEIFTNGDSIHEFGYDPSSPSLPSPRNEAEAMAKQVLDMRAAGRAGDVTNDMMSKVDGPYMYNNTPLPMDEASRMARASDAGFGLDNPQFHSTPADFQAFEPSQTGLAGRGVYTSDEAADALDYTDLPMIDGAQDGMNIMQLEAPDPARLAPFRLYQKTLDEDPLSSWTASGGDLVEAQRRVAEGLTEQGFAGVKSANPQHMVTFDPKNIRSRFARFDPEFKHLSNISAGVAAAPLGLLALQEDRKRANEERYMRGLLQQ